MPVTPIDTRHLVAPELVHGLELMPAFEISEESLPAIREAGAAAPPIPLPPELEAVTREDRNIPGPAGAPDVRVLIYSPPGDARTPRPAYLHIHGGGYIFGTAAMMDPANRAMALTLGCVVVSVDYRIAPETRAPGSVEDCYAALVWLAGAAAELGIDPAKIAIGGESAGGGLSAVLAQLARDRGGVTPCFQFLDSPMLDDRTATSADPHPHAGEFVWTPDSNRFGWRALLGQEPGEPDVPDYAVPARTHDLSGLPPACIAVGALDLFLEENIDYARRLIRAGVPTELHVIPGAYHGFMIAGPETPQGAAHLAWRHAALARAFAGAA